MILCGNKCDMTDERRIYEDQARRLAGENKLTYYDCSAKANQNIRVAFEFLMNEVAIRR